MKSSRSIFLFAFFSILSLPVHCGAAGSNSDKSKLDGLVAFAAGGGTNTISEPQNEVDVDGVLMGEAAVELQALGPLFFTVGALASVSSGVQKYDFKSEDFVHYTADNVKFSTSMREVRVGLKLRIINAEHFHFYVEGGGFEGTFDVSYDILSAPSLVSQGSTYQQNQKNIRILGFYGDAGFDIMMGKFGLRFAGRARSGRTGSVDALASQQMNYKEAYGYIAFLMNP